MDKIYLSGKFEVISFKFLDFLSKFKKNNDFKVIFLFNDSEIMNFETRKLLLEEHLQDLNYEIYNFNYESDKNNFNKGSKRVQENECCQKLASTAKRKKEVKNIDASFKVKFQKMRDVDAPLNYVKYILDNHYFIYDKIFNLMSDERYKHTVSVALTAVEIALNNKIKPKKPFIASMLHDIAKDTSIDVSTKLMRKSFKKHLNEEKVVYHQFIGTIFAQKLFHIYNIDIIRAIKYHTTGNKRMSDCAKIVYSSDKIEPTRGYDSKYMIDACNKDITEGFKLVLSENIIFLKSKGVKIGGLSQKAIDFYKI